MSLQVGDRVVYKQKIKVKNDKNSYTEKYDFDEEKKVFIVEKFADNTFALSETEDCKYFLIENERPRLVVAFKYKFSEPQLKRV